MNKQQTANSKQLLSIIVPAYNEQEVLITFHQTITAIMNNVNMNYEVIYINDGSIDSTESIILQLKQHHPEIVYIKFSRNFGKEAGMTAGFKICRGDAAIIMDADLQDPPSLIPAMLSAWSNGAEVVNMRRSLRQGDPLWKKVTANLFYRLISKISEIPIPANVGDFRLFSRNVINTINQLNERERFMKGIYAWVGYPQATIDYERKARIAGTTKWPFLKLINLAAQGIIAFSSAPLKIAMWLGLISSGSAFIYAGFFLIKSLIAPDAVHGFPTLIIAILFLGGLQLFCIGVLGEYTARIYTEVKQRPIYVIEKFFQ